MSDWGLTEAHAQIAKLHRQAQRPHPAIEILRQRESILWEHATKPTPNSTGYWSWLRRLIAKLSSLLQST